MAMIDWVDRRLNNWARWVVGGGATGLGYAAMQWGSVGSGGNPGAHIPTDAVEASETHDEVMRLPPELRRTMELRYLETENRAVLAAKLACAVATVDTRITRAHRMLADAFMAVEVQRRERRESVEQVVKRARGF